MTNRPDTRNQELQPAPGEHKRESRLRILQEKAACSPRASVALSALSAVTWLREVSSLIYRRITDGRSAKNVVRPGCKVHAIRRATDLCLLITVLTLSRGALPAQASTSAAAPRLVGYSGKLMGAEGKPLARIAGVAFAIYTDQEGGAPLWLETQNVNPDSTGHYNVELGSSRPEGLPHDRFTSGEARWLRAQVDRRAEQPRVLLVSVPYALKAADAGTIGGLPSSGNLYLGMTNTVHKFRVDTNRAVYADGGLNSSGADFAESVAVEGTRAEYEPGDVLEIDKKANRHLALSHATLVAGVYSTKPGVPGSPHHIDEDASAASEVPWRSSASFPAMSRPKTAPSHAAICW